MYVAIFVASIVAVIVFHEFGHFATAKAFHMKAEKFFVGFGPTLWSFRRGETEYGLKLIPAGGFVKIVGMSRFEQIAPEDADRAFFNQPAWQRLIVLVAGSATHFVVAFALLFAGLVAVGVPTDEASNVIAEVVPDTPAAVAGLTPGDIIVAIDGQATDAFEPVRQRVTARPGQELTLTIERDGDRRDVAVTTARRTFEGEQQGFLGVGPQSVVRRYSPVEAAGEVFTGDYSVVRVTGLTLRGLVSAFSPSALGTFFSSAGSDQPRSLTDPAPSSLIGAGRIASELGNSGAIFQLLLLLASLNVTLGTINLLPLPPLDGGHVAVLLVEEGVNTGRRRRGVRERWQLDPSVITPIALAVILFFVVLQVTAVYIDITNPITDALQ